MKLDEDLYVYPWESYTENNCNSYVIGGDLPVLIDPGHSHLLGNLLRSMEGDGLSKESIRCIIATHGHPDHFEGVQDFMDLPVKIGISRAEEEYLRQTGSAFYRAFGGELPRFRIDFYLEEGELVLGDNHFRVINTPGHTPGEICLYWVEKKALFTGDVIFAQSVGRTDFPGGSGRQLRESIDQLALLDTEILLPGHMEVLVGADVIRRNFEMIRSSFFHMM
ncbi:MAG: MBL fold metallo-hydrolase [Deltaproteobacteria bacterium]|nr:MBL fold metallo-hydrolase [Deltaproteobacteria bacterium]MBW2309132.1 MBL fold metallo-hydrolase [Deltaproteobacteria bacterium]